ncbi:MAG: hypothetical protein U0325_00340 [Polyangiales bacterium]
MGTLRLLLAHRRAPLAAALLALLLLSPALAGGFLLDDYSFQLTLHPSTRAQGLGRAGWDLFNFEDGRSGHAALALARGIWPWWTAPDFRLAFLRPLSSSLHAFEFTHLRAHPWLMHAHSLLWYAALVLVVGATHRRLFGLGVTAGVATLLYAIDDAHAFPALWITHRNALIALTLGFGALYHWERRALPAEGERRPALVVGPALFALALLAGEAAFGALAWIVAHALLRDPRARGERLRDLAPYLGLAGTWFLVNRALGYGAAGGGFYIDPARQPVDFAGALFTRLPLLLASQFALPPADAWMQQPPALQRTAAAVLAMLVVAVALGLRRALRGDPRAPFLALGTLLSLIPVCATWPSDRLLLASGFGAFGLIALAVTGPRSTRGMRAAVVVVHVVIAGALLPLKVLAIQGMFGGLVARAADSLPLGATTPETEVLALTSPDMLTPLYAASVHVTQRGHAPSGAIRTLAVHTQGVMRVRRSDARSLEVTLSEGFLHDAMSQIVRGPPWRFRAGETLSAGSLQAEVLAVGAHGRPTRVRFTFAQRLDDPRYRWVRWEGVHFVPWTPPAVDQEETLPAIDLGRAMGGR